MKELEYLDRLSQDLIDNLEKQKKLIPEEDVLVNAIYSNVRETLLSQVLEHKESNPGLSSYLEVLAKKVLDGDSSFLEQAIKYTTYDLENEKSK